MPDVKPPAYPVELTVKGWDKAKGVIAMVTVGKTGVSDHLKTAYAAFEKAPWDKLNVSKALLALNNPTSKEMHGLFNTYISTYQPVFKKLEKTFDDLSDNLKKEAATLEKSDKTKSLAKTVLKMADIAHKFTFAVAWGTISDANAKYISAAILEREKAEKLWAEAPKKLKEMIKTAETALQKHLSKTPTVSEYGSFWKEELRGIGAQIQMVAKSDPSVVPKYKDPMTIARKHWAQDGLPKTDEDVPKQLEGDQKLLKMFSKIANE